MEKLESGILRGFLWDGYRLAMLRYPAGDALPHPQLQPIDRFGMGVFRSIVRRV